jgi:hypothetical protein
LQCTVKFPADWVNALTFEIALDRSGGPHASECTEVRFCFPIRCKIMIDTAIRLLSLVNQLSLTTKRVLLDFEEGEAGTMGYLDRMGFFEHLDPAVNVSPNRPVFSAATIYRGKNTGLVEIARINKDRQDQTLPTRGAAFLIFAELIDNVFSHSKTPLDGFAALQYYPTGKSLKVAVSDSGLGIMDTLRPALEAEQSNLVALSDVDLLVEIFREGISRHGDRRGNGLKGAAGKAMKFGANLDVRLPNLRVFLTPAKGMYQPNKAYCSDRLPLLWGTHIAFEFKLGA